MVIASGAAAAKPRHCACAGGATRQPAGATHRPLGSEATQRQRTSPLRAARAAWRSALRSDSMAAAGSAAQHGGQ
jgi:hypothetical protein